MIFQRVISFGSVFETFHSHFAFEIVGYDLDSYDNNQSNVKGLELARSFSTSNHLFAPQFLNSAEDALKVIKRVAFLS